MHAKICFVLFFVIKAKSSLIPELKYNSINPAILNKCKDYELIVHFDNQTGDALNWVFNIPVSKILYNYDVTQKIKRPVGHQFLNLVYLTNPQQFQIYSENVQNLKYRDAIMIFMVNSASINQEKVEDMSGVERAGTFIVYDTDNEEYYYAKYFHGNETQKLQKIISFNKTVPELQSFTNNFRNFNEYVFKVGFFQNRPFAYCR